MRSIANVAPARKPARHDLHLQYLKGIAIESVAAQLGIDVMPGHRGRCWRRKNHKHDDANPALRFDPKTNRVRCFGGCDPVGGTDTIGLVQQVRGVNFRTAVQWLEARFPMNADSMTTMTMLAAATEYAARGWPVFPCAPKAKRPLTRHGFRDASVDAGQIRAWWTKWPTANIGLATGGAFIVVDVDGAQGEKSFARLIQLHGPLPRTLEATTGRGRHVYLNSNGAYIGSDAGRLGAGLDVRGEGGYVVAPPSIHASGKRYEWTCDAAPAKLPDWLAGKLAEPSSSATMQDLLWSGVWAQLEPTTAKVLAALIELRDPHTNVVEVSYRGLESLAGVASSSVARALHTIESLHALRIERGPWIARLRSCSRYVLTLSDPRFLALLNQGRRRFREERERERLSREEARTARRRALLCTQPVPLSPVQAYISSNLGVSPKKGGGTDEHIAQVATKKAAGATTG